MHLFCYALCVCVSFRNSVHLAIKKLVALDASLQKDQVSIALHQAPCVQHVYHVVDEVTNDKHVWSGPVGLLGERPFSSWCCLAGLI